MRGDDRNDTSCSQQEAFAVCLLECICCFILNMGAILINKSILPHATTHHTSEKMLRFGQRWIGFAVMPIHDLKGEIICQLEVDFLSMQMQHVAPKILCRFYRFPIKDQAKYFIFLVAEKLSLRVLDRVKDSVDACSKGSFDKTTCRFGNRFQSFHGCTGVMAEMFQQ